MKTKFAVVLIVLLVCFALGVTGVFPLARTEAEAAELPGSDRLIGVLVTPEHLDLFDMEAYLNDHLSELVSDSEVEITDDSAYQGRLYAQLVEVAPGKERYEFTNVEGYSYFCARYTDENGTYTASDGDESISHVKNQLNITDAGDSVSLEGTMYISSTSGQRTFFVNPVYQMESGEVYAVSGHGTSFGGDTPAGMSTGVSLTATETRTVNGETVELKSDVIMHFVYMDAPQKIRILQCDADAAVIAQQEFTPGDLPNTLTPEQNTAYILVETSAADGSVSRQLFQQSDDYLSAFFCREDGICIEQMCQILWEK